MKADLENYIDFSITEFQRFKDKRYKMGDNQIFQTLPTGINYTCKNVSKPISRT